jgi:hypothetical protein
MGQQQLSFGGNTKPLAAKVIGLTVGQELFAVFKKIEKDAFTTSLYLDQDGNLIKLLFSRGSMEERIIEAAFRKVSHNQIVRIKRLDNEEKPIEIQKISNFNNLCQNIVLRINQQVDGIFKQMGWNDYGIYVCFETDVSLFSVSFPKESAEEKIIWSSFRCVKHGCRIRIKRTEDLEKPIEIQKIRNFKTDYSFAKRFSLLVGDKIIGEYLELQHDFDEDHLVLELKDRQIAKVSFPKASVEATIVRLRLSHVKHKVKLCLQRTNDSNNPIIMEIIPNTSTKQNCPYLDKRMVNLLKPYFDPSILDEKKQLSDAISKLTEIVINKQVIAVKIVREEVARCNKMQQIGKADRVLCSFLGYTVSRKSCIVSCPAAKEFLKLKGEN